MCLVRLDEADSRPSIPLFQPKLTRPLHMIIRRRFDADRGINPPTNRRSASSNTTGTMCQEEEDPRLMPVERAFRCFGHGKSPADGLWLVRNVDWLDDKPGFKWFACLCRSCENGPSVDQD